METILDYLTKEWGTVMHAPVIFITGWALAMAVGWRIKGALVKQHIAVLEARLAGGPQATARQLSEEQYGEIVRHLSRYAKERRHVDVYHAVGSAENVAFAERLLGAINDAGWHATYRGEHGYLGFRSGVWIYGPIYPGQNERTSEVLKRALAHAGIEAKIDSVRSDSGIPSLIVGGK